MARIGTVAVLVLGLMAGSHAAVLMKVVRGGDAAGDNLIANPGFEQLEGDLAAGWQFWQAGYHLATGEGRDGSNAALCERKEAGEQHGATYTHVLNQRQPTPLLVRGWSKSEGVSGSSDRDYSIYCDLVYTDGTPLWGQISPFRAGTHDWQQVEVLITPARPVRSISIHCLFRNHDGKAWFDDVELYELKAAEGTVLLDSVAVYPATAAQAGGGREVSGGGVALSYNAADGSIGRVAAGATDITGSTPGGFMVRDVAAGSDLHSFEAGACAPLGLELEADVTASTDAIRVAGTLRDTTGKDRAVTLLFALPVAAEGALWGETIQAAAQIGSEGELGNSVRWGTGSNGMAATYPFSCLYSTADAGWGVALGIDINRPCQYRLGYSTGARLYYVAVDLGLVPEQAASPSSAEFGFVIYGIAPEWGFRSAAARYYELFPASFDLKSKQQGIWMPFSKISEVEGWEDFGFKYKEGNNETAWDDAHDMLTFRYTEPSTWWMKMPKDMPRTYEAAMAEAQRIAAEDTGYAGRKAKALFASGLFDEDGRYVMRFLDTPWCDGAVFSMSALPGVEGEINDPKVGWNEETKQKLYGPERNGDLDGEYLDSLEGYVTSDTDFRREHFKVARRPLTFTTRDRRPVIHKGLAVDEFVEWIAADVHGIGKLMMANGVPYRFGFLVRNLDVMGTETDWVRNGEWRPMDHSSLSLKRTLCARKPYLFLMNTDFDALAPYVERYFQRSLFYGMYPSMFSPVASSSQGAYWITPAWYNRDRELHQHYQPIIRRVAEAGWQPVTLATTDAAGVLLERFGPNEAGEVFLTVFNDGTETVEASVRVSAELVGIDATATELVSGAAVGLTREADGVRFGVTLEPEQCVAVMIEG
ncbi:MAG TPA: hypothetical protein DGT21_01400 [Armatimonadetes bacterium]|jgi:hypothetical protein|nr:hypothetical protein [Armatimonadota bacterium]